MSLTTIAHVKRSSALDQSIFRLCFFPFHCILSFLCERPLTVMNSEFRQHLWHKFKFLCIWQMLLCKLTYNAFKIHISCRPWVSKSWPWQRLTQYTPVWIHEFWNWLSKRFKPKKVKYIYFLIKSLFYSTALRFMFSVWMALKCDKLCVFAFLHKCNGALFCKC